MKINFAFLLQFAKPALEDWVKTRALIFPQAKKVAAVNAIEKKFHVSYDDATAIIELVQQQMIDVAVANIEHI